MSWLSQSNAARATRNKLIGSSFRALFEHQLKNKEKEGVDGDKDGGGGGEENITGEGGFSSGIENDKDVKVFVNCRVQEEFRVFSLLTNFILKY